MFTDNSPRKRFRSSGIAAVSAVALSVSGANAATVPDYMIITGSDKISGHALNMSNSELGAIGSNSSTSEPGSLPSLPGKSVRSVADGIYLDGDAAILGNGTVSLSNSDIHSIKSGDLSPGNQGIDCGSAFKSCTDSGSQISSGNRFNQSGPKPSFSKIAINTGVQGNINHKELVSELDELQSLIDSMLADAVIDLSLNSGVIDGKTNEIWDFSGGSSGLTVVDIVTDNNDFEIKDSNLTVKGDADDYLIFRVETFETMKVSNSNLLLDGDIGANNVLFYVDADEGENSFDFINVSSNGFSLWDLGLDPDNVISFSNVEFCGQLISDQVDLSNASGTGCEFGGFDMSPVPVPPAVFLFGSALLGLVGFQNRKQSKRS